MYFNSKQHHCGQHEGQHPSLWGGLLSVPQLNMIYVLLLTCHIRPALMTGAAWHHPPAAGVLAQRGRSGKLGHTHVKQSPTWLYSLQRPACQHCAARHHCAASHHAPHPLV